MKIELEDLQPFKEILREAVREEMKSYLSSRGQDEDIILDVPGLCEYLKVTSKWVYEQTHLKTIPHIKLSGKVLRFKKRDIDKWIEKLRTPAITEPTGKIKLLR